MDIPQEWLLLEHVVAPRNWERAYGYTGDARYLSISWEQAGNEAMLYDGSIGRPADSELFQEFVRVHEIAILEALRRARPPAEAGEVTVKALGSHDQTASHCLILDCASRFVYVAEKGSAYKVLYRLKPAPDPVSPAPSKPLFPPFGQPKTKPLAAASRLFTKCTVCRRGWVRSEDGGFDPCPAGCDHGRIWKSES